VPIANLVFAIPFMPRSSPAQWQNALGLVFILGGLVTYRFWPAVEVVLRRALGLPPPKAAAAPEEDASAALLQDSSVAASSDVDNGA
jgi:hypothetical protein